MLVSSNNSSKPTMSTSDMSSLSHCLSLEPITLGNQKITRTGELKRVLRFPLASTSEGHSNGAEPSRPPALANEELKHFKESVQDASKKAGDRARVFRQSMIRIDRFTESLNSKKRQRSDMSGERFGVNLEKMGSQPQGNSRDLCNQKMEQRPKSSGLVKRLRTSVADIQGDSKLIAMPRLPIKEKKEEKLQVGNGSSLRTEEKIRKVPAGSDVWEKKTKRKRSVSAVGARVIINADTNPKEPVDSKPLTDPKLRTNDGHGFRSKSSPAVTGVSKLNIRFESPSPNACTVLRNEQDANSSPLPRMEVSEQRVLLKGNKSNNQESELGSSSSLSIKGKASRAPRTGLVMVIDPSPCLPSSSVGGPSVMELPSNANKITATGVANDDRINSTSPSTSQPMAKWGQKKNSSFRRANVLSPVTPHPDIQNVSREPNSRKSSVDNGGSLLVGSFSGNNLKVKKELQKVSAADVPETEESGASESRLKEKAVDSSDVALTPSHDAGGSVSLPKNRHIHEIGDGVRRQGRSGRGVLMKSGVHPPREKVVDQKHVKTNQGIRPTERNKRSGRPSMKKLKDRKAFSRAGSVLDGGSSEFTGELEDDHETLLAAANLARNSLNQACPTRFWKRMDPIFGSVSTEDVSYLKKQLSHAEEIDDRLFGKMDHGKPLKDSLLFERLLSALIDEEGEENYHQAEGKNMSLQCVSDDSHCGSCNQMDIESRDHRDRIESEVESVVEQNHKLCFLDRLSCNRGATASNTFRNSSVSISGYSNELSFGDDDYSHPDMAIISEICSNDDGRLQLKELNVPTDVQYQSMSLDDRIMLELQSIDLYPEVLPDLAEEGEVISDDIAELEEKLHQQVAMKRKNLGQLDKAVMNAEDADKRKIEELAMQKTVEMAYKRRMACRVNNTSKSSVRRVPNQVAAAFIKRTLSRCQKYEETGVSSFREPALKDVLFSTPASKNDAKSIDCVGSGTASNTCNEVMNHPSEAKGSGAISSTLSIFDSSHAKNITNMSFELNFDKHTILHQGKKMEVSLDIKSTAVSGPKTKQRLKGCQDPSPRPGPTAPLPVPAPQPPVQPVVNVEVPKNLPKGGDEAMDLDNLGLDGNQDLGTFLNFDVEGDQDYTDGLEVPPWDDFLML